MIYNYYGELYLQNIHFRFSEHKRCASPWFNHSHGLSQPRPRPNPPAILARRGATSDRALRPARAPRAQPRLGPRKPQPAGPRSRAVRDEGHHGGRNGLLGQGGEGVEMLFHFSCSSGMQI